MNQHPESPSPAYALAAINFASLFVHKALPWILMIVLLRAAGQLSLELSGADNLLSAWLEFSSQLKVTRGFAFIFGGIGLLFGMQQRRLRQLEQSQFSSRISELEHEISRNR